MKIKYLLAASIVSLSAAATFSAPVAAQQITSGVEGNITDASGNPLPGANVTITDERNGSSRTATTGSNGEFRVQSLQPGGPYTVTVTADGFGRRVHHEIRSEADRVLVVRSREGVVDDE